MSKMGNRSIIIYFGEYKNTSDKLWMDRADIVKKAKEYMFDLLGFVMNREEALLIEPIIAQIITSNPTMPKSFSAEM
jgi:hypothetical protein